MKHTIPSLYYVDEEGILRLYGHEVLGVGRFIHPVPHETNPPMFIIDRHLDKNIEYYIFD